MNVLIIKITSLGDVIHTLPALTEAKKQFPNATFEWVVAPEFSDLLKLNPALSCTINCPIRHWRGRYVQALRHKEIQQFIHNLRQKSYDLIVDAQSALKSALIGKIARGTQSGYDKNCVREYGAHWFYQKRWPVEKKQHAITRLRMLFASALHYSINPTDPDDFGINPSRLPTLSLMLPKDYVMIIPNTTWPTKHWPDAHWNLLLQKIQSHGIMVVIPWGNDLEKRRAQALSMNHSQVMVLPKLTLLECASVIARAKAAVCVDTGLGHLASALNIPAVHLYGPTHPNRIGARGPAQITLTAPIACKPSCKRLCYFESTPSNEAACLRNLSVDTVWQSFETLLK